MTTLPVRVERRVGQRFSYLLPLSLRQCGSSLEGVGFTQDLSSRGAFFFTDAPLVEGAEIEITLQMPSEITLGESMRVRCRGHILRVVKPVASVQDSSSPVRAETKIGVALRLEGYEYLKDSSEAASTFPRVSVLHQHGHDTPLDSQVDDDRPLAHASARPVLS
jgi:PilZ domain